MSYEVGRFLSWLWLKLCYGLRGHGQENLPATGGCLIASNHTSIIDPMALGCVVERPLTFIARGTLKGNWLYRWLTKALDIVSIRRDATDKAALAAVREALNAGKACVIFPEGTRSADGTMQPFKGGVALLARMCKVPVVPAWIEGSFQAWPRTAKLPRFHGRVEVRYGAPLRLDEIPDREQALTVLREAIESLSRPRPE